MKKITLTLAVAALGLFATEAIAQDKTAAVQTEERSAENIQKEADVLKKRITDYTAKVEANRSNETVDYEAEQVRISEMKAQWEELTGKSWEHQEKVEKM